MRARDENQQIANHLKFVQFDIKRYWTISKHISAARTSCGTTMSPCPTQKHQAWPSRRQRSTPIYPQWMQELPNFISKYIFTIYILLYLYIALSIYLYISSNISSWWFADSTQAANLVPFNGVIWSHTFRIWDQNTFLPADVLATPAAPWKMQNWGSTTEHDKTRLFFFDRICKLKRINCLPFTSSITLRQSTPILRSLSSTRPAVTQLKLLPQVEHHGISTIINHQIVPNSSRHAACLHLQKCCLMLPGSTLWCRIVTSTFRQLSLLESTHCRSEFHWRIFAPFTLNIEDDIFGPLIPALSTFINIVNVKS